ncbi:hypothetical protein NHX12_016864 [Muraenolepis orangiensis]|uniref:Uncharacterized protein n=1 Tax=Muraenolepis orangiensis TaxID=630683 RepID=A0A9Q0I044_9TELE|nr:hypothetical protein NHX12_016864 [Muraenolepis orangiensis]
MKEKVLQCQQGSSTLTVEAGRQLLLSADSRTEVGLQGALTQDGWGQANASQDVHKRELEGTPLRDRTETCLNLNLLMNSVSSADDALLCVEIKLFTQTHFRLKCD